MTIYIILSLRTKHEISFSLSPLARHTPFLPHALMSLERYARSQHESCHRRQDAFRQFGQFSTEVAVNYPRLIRPSFQCRGNPLLQHLSSTWTSTATELNIPWSTSSRIVGEDVPRTTNVPND
jgi:hypothetical protein